MRFVTLSNIIKKNSPPIKQGEEFFLTDTVTFYNIKRRSYYIPTISKVLTILTIESTISNVICGICIQLNIIPTKIHI